MLFFGFGGCGFESRARQHSLKKRNRMMDVKFLNVKYCNLRFQGRLIWWNPSSINNLICPMKPSVAFDNCHPNYSHDLGMLWLITSGSVLTNGIVFLLFFLSIIIGWSLLFTSLKFNFCSRKIRFVFPRNRNVPMVAAARRRCFHQCSYSFLLMSYERTSNTNI